MAVKIKITSYKCPKCGHILKTEFNDGSLYGKKYDRCPKCGYIYSTGKILYSDLSEQELVEQKNIRKEFYMFFIPIFLISLVVTIITGWELVGIVAFLSGFIIVYYFFSSLSDKTKTLKNISKIDSELYDLETEQSEKMKNSNE